MRLRKQDALSSQVLKCCAKATLSPRNATMPKYLVRELGEDVFRPDFGQESGDL